MKNLIFPILVLLACIFFLAACASLDFYFEEAFEGGDTGAAEGHSEGDETTGRRDVSKNPGPALLDVGIYRIGGIDVRVKEVPSSIEKRIFSNPGAVIEDLVDYLVDDEDDPFMQVKLLHDWITDNIAYDTDAFFSGSISGTGWEATLKTKSSVCQGYSELFNKMCALAGIESTIITGYARGYGDDLFAPEDFSDSNHAWNGVKIDDFWYLVDCTWDAGNVNGTVFEKDYSTSYLFIKPEHNIFTHYPDNPAWQLLEKPKKPEEIDESPWYSGDYFFYGFDPFPGVGQVNRAEESFHFSFPLPPEITLMAHIADMSGAYYQNYCLIQNRGGTADVSVRFPSPGNWMVQLYGSVPGEEEYAGVAEIGVIASRASTALFPVLYTPFIEDQCYLYSPLDNPLPAGRDVEFRMKLPGYKEIYISADAGSFTLSPGPDDVFSGTITIPPSGEFTVSGSKEENGLSYTGLVGYTIERE